MLTQYKNPDTVIDLNTIPDYIRQTISNRFNAPVPSLAYPISSSALRMKPVRYDYISIKDGYYVEGEYQPSSSKRSDGYTARVLVDYKRRFIVAGCTCPVGRNGKLCKHVLAAMGFGFLAREDLGASAQEIELNYKTGVGVYFTVHKTGGKIEVKPVDAIIVPQAVDESKSVEIPELLRNVSPPTEGIDEIESVLRLAAEVVGAPWMKEDMLPVGYAAMQSAGYIPAPPVVNLVSEPGRGKTRLASVLARVLHRPVIVVKGYSLSGYSRIINRFYRILSEATGIPYNVLYGEYGGVVRSIMRRKEKMYAYTEDAASRAGLAGVTLDGMVLTNKPVITVGGRRIVGMETSVYTVEFVLDKLELDDLARDGSPGVVFNLREAGFRVSSRLERSTVGVVNTPTFTGFDVYNKVDMEPGEGFSMIYNNMKSRDVILFDETARGPIELILTDTSNREPPVVGMRIVLMANNPEAYQRLLETPGLEASVDRMTNIILPQADDPASREKAISGRHDVIDVSRLRGLREAVRRVEPTRDARLVVSALFNGLYRRVYLLEKEGQSLLGTRKPPGYRIVGKMDRVLMAGHRVTYQALEYAKLLAVMGVEDHFEALLRGFRIAARGKILVENPEADPLEEGEYMLDSYLDAARETLPNLLWGDDSIPAMLADNPVGAIERYASMIQVASGSVTERLIAGAVTTVVHDAIITGKIRDSVVWGLFKP